MEISYTNGVIYNLNKQTNKNPHITFTFKKCQ